MIVDMDTNSLYNQAMITAPGFGVAWSETMSESGGGGGGGEAVIYTHQMHRRRRGHRILVPFLVLEFLRRWLEL